MGQVIMPEILSDHDLDWGGSGTPIASGTYFATTSQQTIIADAGDYAVASGGINIGGLAFRNLVPANIKAGETITVSNGRDTWSVTGTGAGVGYKLQIIDNVARASGTIPITMSGGNVLSACHYILIPASSISSITPKIALAVPYRQQVSHTACTDCGGGFIHVDNGTGNINDTSDSSGMYSISTNQNVVWCNNNSGIKMPVNTGTTYYDDEDDNHIYAGPTAYTVFVVGVPR